MSEQKLCRTRWRCNRHTDRAPNRQETESQHRDRKRQHQTKTRPPEDTYSALRPAAVDDGQGNKRHHSDPHQEVTDGQVHDQHRRDYMEAPRGCHNDKDEKITCTRTQALTQQFKRLDFKSTFFRCYHTTTLRRTELN